MGRIEQIDSEITDLTNRISKLQGELMSLHTKNHIYLKGKCYRESEYSVRMVTDVNDVWRDRVYVTILKVTGPYEQKSGHFRTDVIESEFREGEYNEITKEEFYDFFNKSVELTRGFIINEMTKGENG